MFLMFIASLRFRANLDLNSVGEAREDPEGVLAVPKSEDRATLFRRELFPKSTVLFASPLLKF